MNPLVRYWWALALRGVAAVLFGILAIFWPGITILSLVMVFGAFAIVDGVVLLVAAIRKDGKAHGPMLLIQAIVGIVFGLIALFAPIATAIALVLLIAGWSIVTGVLEILVAIRLRKEIEGEWMLVVSGALSILLGVGLAAIPGMGVVAMAWIIGVYAIVAGVVLIALALRLRGLAQPLATPRTVRP